MHFLRPGWMREIISNPIKQRVMQSRYTVKRCTGHFFDEATRKRITIDMGEVSIRVPLVFRAASSTAEVSSVLEGIDGAAQSAKKSSGSYVTPGQSAMDGIKC